MRYIALISICICLASNSLAQDSTAYRRIREKAIHQHSDKPGRPVDCETPKPKEQVFAEHVAKYYLNNPGDTLYFTDRSELIKIESDICLDSLKNFSFLDADSNSVSVLISLSNYTHKRQIEKWKEECLNNKYGGCYIDSNFFGLNPVDINKQIKEIEVGINDSSYVIDTSAYYNLLNPKVCQAILNNKSIELYTDSTNSFFYLYIFGGPFAFSEIENELGHYYLAKIIFTKEELLATIVVDEKGLSKYGMWYIEEFIGF